MGQASRDKSGGRKALDELATVGLVVAEADALITGYVDGHCCDNCGAALPDADERLCEMCHEDTVCEECGESRKDCDCDPVDD